MTERLGRFEIDHLVEALDGYLRFRAWDPERGKHASVLLVSDRGRFERIRDATARVSALDHRRFAAVIGDGIADHGAGFVAFEWAEGTSLLARLRDGPLGVPETEELAFALVDALGALQDAGLSHGALTPKNVFLVEGIASRAKLFGFGEDAADDAAGDALALARLVVGCNAMSARKGSARGRGWDRVAQFEPALGKFIRGSLGEYGQRADRHAALDALRALRAAIEAGEAAPRSRKVAAVAVVVSAVLVAKFEGAVATEGDERPAPTGEALGEVAARTGVACSVYADGTLSATAPLVSGADGPADGSLAAQTEALVTVALAWREAFRPMPQVIAASSSAEPDSAEPYLRAMIALEETAPGAIALDDLAAHAASGTFTLSRSGARARVLRRRPAWLTSQTAMGGFAAGVVLFLLFVLIAKQVL